MNKAKKKRKRNELVYFTTMDVFGKPVHVPNVYEKGGRPPIVAGGTSSGKASAQIQIALDMQKTHKKIRVVARNLKDLDYLVSQGIQPSNICIVSEFDCEYTWYEFRITPDGMAKA